MTDTPAEPTVYELCTKPAKEITDAELERILTHLRSKREAFKSGKPDNPKAEAKAKTVVTADSKKAQTAAILAELDLKI